MAEVSRCSIYYSNRHCQYNHYTDRSNHWQLNCRHMVPCSSSKWYRMYYGELFFGEDYCTCSNSRWCSGSSADDLLQYTTSQSYLKWSNRRCSEMAEVSRCSIYYSNRHCQYNHYTYRGNHWQLNCRHMVPCSSSKWYRMYYGELFFGEDYCTCSNSRWCSGSSTDDLLQYTTSQSYLKWSNR